jgi:hypothetical protein
MDSGGRQFEGIVEPSLFHTRTGIILARSRKLSDDEMLEKLRGVLASTDAFAVC